MASSRVAADTALQSSAELRSGGMVLHGIWIRFRVGQHGSIPVNHRCSCIRHLGDFSSNRSQSGIADRHHASGEHLSFLRQSKRDLLPQRVFPRAAYCHVEGGGYGKDDEERRTEYLKEDAASHFDASNL